MANVTNRCVMLFYKKVCIHTFAFYHFTFALNSIYASADAAFAAEGLTAFAGAHTGAKAALSQLLDLTFTMIFHRFLLQNWFSYYYPALFTQQN